MRTFGSKGADKAQFNVPGRLCFSAAGHILVAESQNMRVQEVTLMGQHVRFIGSAGWFSRGINERIWAVAASPVFIAVGKISDASSSRIVLFDAVSGALVRSFGELGHAPGQLMQQCNGIRFTRDGSCVVVAESSGYGQGRVSVFTVAGDFVRTFGRREVKGGADVEFADNGDVIVSCRRLAQIFVYSPDGRVLLRQWGRAQAAGSDTPSADAAGDVDLCEGRSESGLGKPTALALSSGRLYVLDREASTNRIQVFE